MADPKEDGKGLEGAADKDAGVLRKADVEGGEELSIGGGPPSAAGGQTPDAPVPTQRDMDDN